ncbi:hypothetical protein B296_00045161 [Ensete ventricosum]|uniref:Uncharacterized protein n=1 Tax=Ensete ventricosum TaxID=4639 RepID=A0A426YMP7_ENSVE|nr:hypothetical protein B296_00045161 [Ensete ventricosum]
MIGRACPPRFAVCEGRHLFASFVVSFARTTYRKERKSPSRQVVVSLGSQDTHHINTWVAHIGLPRHRTHEWSEIVPAPSDMVGPPGLGGIHSSPRDNFLIGGTCGFRLVRNARNY